MKRPLLILLLAIATVYAAPLANNLVIEGRVLQKSTSAALPDVLVLLGSGSEDTTTSPVPRAGANLSTQLQTFRSRLTTRAPTSMLEESLRNVLKATGSSASLASYTYTDSAGRFTFKDLPPGHYTVRAAREGYFGPKINGRYQPAFAKSIELDPNHPLVSVDVLMTQGGIVTGYVRSGFGVPFRTPVTAYRMFYRNGKERWESELATTSSPTGEFRLLWLAPGEVYVASRGIYYKDVRQPELATPVTVKEGETTAIEIHLPNASSVPNVSGNAINAFAVPDAKGSVDRAVSTFFLVPRNPLLQDDLLPVANLVKRDTPARVNGDFDIGKVQPGSYELIAFVKDPDTGHSLVGRAPIDVGGSDLLGVPAPIRMGSTLSGKFVVVGPGTEQIRPDSFSVSLEILGLLPKQFARELDPIVIEPNGYFGALHVPEEQYELIVGHLPPSAYVEDIRTLNRSVFDDGGFYLDDATGLISIFVRTQGQTVTGTVRSVDGIPADAATVVFIPPQQQRQNPIRYRVASTDSNGQFKLQNVPPGEFTVLAWENVLPTAWMNTTFLEKYEKTGRRVNVSGGPSIDLQLPMIPDKR